jgi:hypothetical protein
MAYCIACETAMVGNVDIIHHEVAGKMVVGPQIQLVILSKESLNSLSL